MTPREFRWLFLPYCLERQADGSYVVQNRSYKPVGLTRQSHMRYEEFPVRVRFKGLTATRIKKISWEGSSDPAVIYLYNDGSVPTHSDEDWSAYTARLAVLARLEVVPSDDPDAEYDGPLKV